MLKSIPQARFLALTLLASGLAIGAQAETIGSFVGATAPGLSNSTFTYDNLASGTSEVGTLSASAPVAGYYLPGAYNAPFAGTAYISFSSDGGDGTGITYYTTTLTGNLAGATGSINYLVDNDLGITLNGHTVLAQGETVTYGAFQSYGNVVSIPTGDFVDGTNTFVFGVYNGGGPTALDFAGTVTPAATPEPGSLVLLGTGILGLAGAARRRLSK